MSSEKSADFWDQAAAVSREEPPQVMAQPDVRFRPSKTSERSWLRHERRRSCLWLFASVLLHGGAIAAIALFETGARSDVAGKTTTVELVSKIPEPIAPSENAKSAAASPRSEPRAPKPTPLLLRKPPPEPPPQPKSATQPPKAPSQTPAKAPEEPVISQNALPFFSMPNGLVSNVLSGEGQEGASYKGLVFGMLARAQRAPVAHARGESGQAVVSFTVDDKGQLASLALAQSSGHADLDAEALAMVRRVAPFPPPPANATRSFAAAIDFGTR
jgi:TonB family protein